MWVSGEYWKGHRKIITPTFHFKVLEKFVPVFVKNSLIFVDKLMKLTDQDVDIMTPVALCSLDIICGKFTLKQYFFKQPKLLQIK